MNQINLNLFQKIYQINQYLTRKLTINPNYQNLIDELNQILEDWRDTPIRITIISHSEVFLEKIKSIKETNLKLRYLCQLQTETLPNNLEKVIRNCDLLCLINDGSQPVSESEQKLIHKITTTDIIAYCLIIINDNYDKERSETTTLPSYLLNKQFQHLNSYLFPDFFLERITYHQELKEYHQFLESILETCFINLTQKLQTLSINRVHTYFEKNKAQYFSQIQQEKSIFINGQRIDQFKQQINQFSNKFNQTVQNTFKEIKQELNQAKLQLTNPFLSDTMMYRVQSAIQNSFVIEYQEKDKTFLCLALKNQNYNQSTHSYIMELCQQELDLWLEKQWQIIYNDRESGLINQFITNINQKLEFINALSQKTTIAKIESKFTFAMEDYISLSVLEENNRIAFDYHYSQSAWFRIVLVLLIVGIIFIFTDKIFGFIILFIQLLNLFTGRDPKKIKVKQQTKEIQRIMDNRCQFLVRFIVDKLLQNFSCYLDNQAQQYQQEINLIIQEAEQELDQIKQNIEQNKEQIAMLQEDQARIINMLKNS